jgi:hypothetical protein
VVFARAGAEAEAVAVTVAVNVMFVPLAALSVEDASAVEVAVVEAAFTTCDRGADVEVAKLEFPL